MSTAKEFASRGITVNAICPGFIDSDMTKELPPEYLVRNKFASHVCHSFLIINAFNLLEMFRSIFIFTVSLAEQTHRKKKQH